MTGPLGERPLGTRAPRGLDEAILFTTFPEIGTEADRTAFARVRDTARLTRYGMDCYAYALVAAGQIDLVVEAGLYPYDVGAPIAVIEAAGGVVTNWEGRPAHEGGRIVAAANSAIHAEALALLLRHAAVWIGPSGWLAGAGRGWPGLEAALRLIRRGRALGLLWAVVSLKGPERKRACSHAECARLALRATPTGAR